MSPSVLTDTRPEAMGDVPGICEVPLTRAVVQYRDVHEMDAPGGRIEDIGLGLVVDGRYASSSEAIDLGSGRLKVLDLSTELVVLDWVYEPTLQHVSSLLAAAGSNAGDEALKRYAFRLGLRVLERVGFGPLTRPSFLRIGFRDICRDLDLHEGTSIRVVLGPGRLSRIHLDYDSAALVFRTAYHEPDARLEHALLDAFEGAEVRRLVPGASVDALSYQVRFPLPETLDEARADLAAMRMGIASVVARFEPERFEALGPMLDTFGTRETLAALPRQEPSVRAVRVRTTSGSRLVH